MITRTAARYLGAGATYRPSSCAEKTDVPKKNDRYFKLKHLNSIIFLIIHILRPLPDTLKPSYCKIIFIAVALAPDM